MQIGLGVLGELQMRSRRANGRSHSILLSPVPPSKWVTWFGGSRWWHCGLAQKIYTELVMTRRLKRRRKRSTLCITCLGLNFST